MSLQIIDEGDGDIGLDIDVGNDRCVSITLYADGRVGWSGLADGHIGQSRDAGTLTLPLRVRAFLLDVARKQP